MYKSITTYKPPQLLVLTYMTPPGCDHKYLMECVTFWLGSAHTYMCIDVQLHKPKQGSSQ